MSEQRWPVAVATIEAGDGDETVHGTGTISEQLVEALRFYANAFPELKTEDKIEMSNIAAVSGASVFFGLDLKILALQNADIKEALANETSEIWVDLSRMVTSEIPNFAGLILAYLRWAFVKVEQKVWELGDRPPVGRYTPGAARRAGSRPSGGFGGPRRSGPPSRPGDRDRGPRRDGGGSDRDKGPGSRGRDRDGPRDNNRDRDRGGDKSRPRGAPRGENRDRSSASHADQEALAVETVKVAIDKLRSDTALAEVRLDPSNSFFRRLQHKKAVSDGFYSYSTGEGAGRSVVVTRDKPAGEEGE
ncbi:hypothetical protein EON80_31000 [bacterium]|nr:MAG: hypothetical protein EON80_31000 [bacterium]